MADAVKVTEARRRGRLGCGHWTYPGQTIARVDGRWVCAACWYSSAARPANTRTPPGGM